MMKQIIRTAIDRLGYEVRRKSAPKHFGYDLEKEADELIAQVRPYTMLPKERLVTLYQQVVYCEKNGISGDFVECGVWKGGSVALMALANLRKGKKRRKIHLYDAFTEICEPDAAVDGKRAVDEVKAWSKAGGTDGKLIALSGIYDSFGGPGSLQGNRDLIEKEVGYDPLFLEYHVGWFQDTLPISAPKIQQIAILRLDGDWYASTKVCLDHLYSKVVRGGIIVIDDYGAYEGCRKAVDEFRAQLGIHDYLHHVDSDCRYWIKS